MATLQLAIAGMFIFSAVLTVILIIFGAVTHALKKDKLLLWEQKPIRTMKEYFRLKYL